MTTTPRLSPCHNRPLAIEPVWLSTETGRLRIGDAFICVEPKCKDPVQFFKAGRDCPKDIGSQQWSALKSSSPTGPWYLEKRGDRHFPERWNGQAQKGGQDYAAGNQ